MPIQFPIRSDVINRNKADVQAELPESNPFLKNSFLRALITGFSGRIFDFYYQLSKNLLPQLFPDTATGIYLERWGSYIGITRNPATQSTGSITVSGTAGSVIPLGTEYQSTDAYTYTTQSTKTILSQSISISSLTRSGTTATATTASAHNLATGISVTISGANETEYNGAYTITVTDTDAFEYTITGTPATPATGTILATHVTASLSLKSEDYGQDVNLDAGTPLTITTSISGVNDTGYVQYGAIGGGADIEEDEDLRDRILFKFKNPTTPFNSLNIEVYAKSISGVTRVWVEEVTPAVGQVTTYFVRDNDANIIPTASEVTTVKNKILEIKPANTETADVIVSAPVAVPVTFSFSALTPNTANIQTSITNNLTVLFKEQTNVGVDLSEDDYRGAINNAYDSETGLKVSSFTLSNPSGDITVATGEIATLSTITYP